MTSADSRRTVAIIPARMGSTRLPGKPLADIAGKPMVQWVYERAMSARGVDEALVATPDAEIAAAVAAFGGKAAMTSERHPSGTDRVAEAAAGLRDDDIVLNVQGDEPMISPEAIEGLIPPLLLADPPQMTSLMRPLTPDEVGDPSVVKVVVDRDQRALYFSRSAIPYVRNERPGNQLWGHIGLYGYTVRALRAFSRLEPGLLESVESLEQLRALENGWTIRMVVTAFTPVAVDTPEDLEKVRRLLGG